MKDALGTEIHEGDLCLNIASGYITPVILIGGTTKSGNPRTMELSQRRKKKGWAETYNLVKATPEQFTDYVEERQVPYWQRYLNQAEQNLLELGEDCNIEAKADIEEDINHYRGRIEEWRTSLAEMLETHRQIVEAR